MPARLIVENGLAAPGLCDVDDGASVLLGRHRDSTIVLQDRHASRQHARLFSCNGNWILKDLETTNGTRIDGAPITCDTPLADGQVIAIGDVRLRFTLARPPREEAADEPHLVTAHALDSVNTTLFQADELTALLSYMNSSLSETTAQGLVSLALKVVLQQTGADMAGFLSLDGDNPELRLVLPVQAEVDRRLSHQLTQQVLREGQSVWLGGPHAVSLESDSLSGFHDAICVPLRPTMPASISAIEGPLGALHVYSNHRTFSERHLRFVELLANSLAGTLYALRGRTALEADNSRLRVHAATADDLVGSSPAMAALRQNIRRLADCPCTVLIIGESGVGKELVALGLHRQSVRDRGPLVTVNCAAISATMAESELFGHARGSFTGAVNAHPGYFAQADMGTLFLDELGELSLEMQAKLLRAIETKCFRPVGARSDTRADVRIIAATNRDLEQEVRSGRFRRDLYFRLTSHIVVPPLREHPEDVPELVHLFLERLAAEYRKRVTLSDSAMQRLQTASWPGNVRQLRSTLETALAVAPAQGTIHAGDLHLPDKLNASPTDRPASLNLEELEVWAIRHALVETGSNNTHAARLLGIHRETLIAKIKKYGLGRSE